MKNSTRAESSAAELLLPQIGWLLLAGCIARKKLWPGSGFFPHNLPDETGNQWTVSQVGDDGFRVTCETATFRKNQLACDIRDRQKEQGYRAQHLRAQAGEPLGVSPTERMVVGIAALPHEELLKDAEYARLDKEIARMQKEQASYQNREWTFPMTGELSAMFSHVAPSSEGQEIIYGKGLDSKSDKEQRGVAQELEGSAGQADPGEEVGRGGKEVGESGQGSAAGEDVKELQEVTA